MEVFTIKLENNDAENLQRAQYEYDTISDLISRNSNNSSDFWLEKLVESNMRLQLYKNEITKKYIVPKVDRDRLDKTNWSADFLNDELKVTIDEE